MTLEPLSLKIQHALGLPADSVLVRRIGMAQRPLITVIDPSFEDKNELERQRDVRQRLRNAHVEPDDLGFIMTSTPEEDKALRDDLLDEPESGSAEEL